MEAACSSESSVAACSIAVSDMMMVVVSAGTIWMVKGKGNVHLRTGHEGPDGGVEV